MLIIALGVLTLMAILGAAFASLIRLEKKATDNYVDAKRMDLLLDSALDRVIAELQGAKNFRSFTYYKDSPWMYLMKEKSGQLEGDVANGRVDVEDDRVGKWEVFSEQAGQTYRYKSKIIDGSAQINLNGRQDTLARMLDNLGLAIERSQRMTREGKKPYNPFYEKPHHGGSLIRGTQILQLRQRLPGSRFSSKSQLRLLIGPENFDLVKDYVTVNSWEDPDTYKPTDGLDEVPAVTGLASTAVSQGRSVGGGNKGVAQSAAAGVPRLDSEPRHPINVNTAPEEVLIACLQGLAGRRVFPFSKLGAGGSMKPVDEGASILGDRTIAQEEYRDVTPRAVFVYSPRLEYDHAKKIAERIIQKRKERPFMAWRTNDPGQQGFEDLIDSLDSSFFPSPGSCQAIDPEQPIERQTESLILRGATTEIGRLWVKGHGLGAVRQTRVQLGLSFHETYAWYYDLVKGVIKANANPNSRINRYNPNGQAYIAVDKSDLVWAKDRVTLLKGHTTEFCFDTNGIYEVTTLGRIAERAKGLAPSTGVAGTEASAGPIGRVNFDRKVRSVVKVFDVLRHTNQFQFERTFQSGPRSSANDRKYVVTWPDPMAALTELISSGSVRDGRVELAGILDGRRLEAPIQQRASLLRNYPAVLMAHDFQDRDPQSIARLQRVASQGGGVSQFGDEFSDAVRDVLDATFSRNRPAENRHYVRKKEFSQLGGQVSREALPVDPEVNHEQLGTDLFPDGINSSLLRASNLQCHTLILPAHERNPPKNGGAGLGLGTGDRERKRTDLLGNVAYYRGGIAFWVKLDFDGDDPVFSGLIGCTQVVTPVVPAASDFKGSEGTQFFIFKNSKGELRIIRMYYHQAFLAQAGSEGGSTGVGGGEAEGAGFKMYPDPGTGNSSGGGNAGGGNAGGGNMQNPIERELDPKKQIARSDLVLDVSHWKAHEWHHIGVDWDDQSPNKSLQLFVDFQRAEGAGTVRHAQSPDTIAAMKAWVRLNERQPRDGLMVNSIIREQGVKDAGVFKWFTSTTRAEGGGGGVVTIAPSVKRILGNATIDELVTFEGPFEGVKQYYGPSGAPGYFTQQPGEYANMFEIPLPADVDSVVLRSFDWTSYYPTTYTDSKPNAQPQRMQVTPIQCELSYNAGNQATPSSFFDPWRQPSVQNQVAGRVIFRRQTGLRGNNAELVYKFRLTPSRSVTGGGAVQTPIIDDVTLTYFLPSPKILVQEEAE